MADIDSLIIGAFSVPPALLGDTPEPKDDPPMSAHETFLTALWQAGVFTTTRFFAPMSLREVLDRYGRDGDG